MEKLDVKKIAEKVPEEGVYFITNFLKGEGEEDEWEKTEKRIGTTLDDQGIEGIIVDEIIKIRDNPQYNKPGSKLSFAPEERKIRRVYLKVG